MNKESSNRWNRLKHTGENECDLKTISFVTQKQHEWIFWKANNNFKKIKNGQNQNTDNELDTRLTTKLKRKKSDSGSLAECKWVFFSAI